MTKYPHFKAEIQSYSQTGLKNQRTSMAAYKNKILFLQSNFFSFPVIQKDEEYFFPQWFE